MSKLTQTFKGQIKRETDKALQVTVIGDEIFDTWIPKSAINKKSMPGDYLLNEGVQEFHITEWFIDLKKTEAKDKARKEADTTKAGFLETADRVSTEPAPEIKTQTVIIPAQPEGRPYFPAMAIFELRDYHANEKRGDIRGHIENIIQDKIAEDQRAKIVDQLESIENLLRMLLEEKK